MHNKQKRLSSLNFILFSVIIMLSSLLLFSNKSLKNYEEPKSQIPYTVISPKIPETFSFAGEVYNLSRSDLRERMDREILTFTYSHINTQLMIKRANRLFPIIEPILKECGVPDDFKYLMIIESNGDCFARSSAGAAGLWQFMEATGKQYGLEINTYIDERYNTEKATRAACRYLKNSHSTLGDWMTVAASYNAGPAHVSKRVREQLQNCAMDLWLVPETSRYLFRLLTAKLIFSNPIQYGFILRSNDLYPEISIAKTVVIDDRIENWAAFAATHKLNFMQLRNANPWIRENSLINSSRKSYTVIIPDSAALHYDPTKTKAHNPDWVTK